MAQQARNNDRDAEKARALVVVQPPRLPMPSEAREFGLESGQWKALVDAIFPSARSVSGVMLALHYCKSRDLDVFKRAVHIVPMWSTAHNDYIETVWPGINEIRTTASRTGSHAGNDDCVFGPTLSRAFEESEQRGKGQNSYKVEAKCPKFDFPEWAQVTVYRIVQGARVPFVGPKVRFVEMFSGEKGLRVPNSKWRSSPWQMLEKCAEAAALRRAFPEELANDYTADEMEGKVIHQPLVEHAAVIDGGDATATTDKRPTREGVAADMEDTGETDPETWHPTVKKEFDLISTKIDKTDDPDALKRAKTDCLARVDGKWPAAAVDEIGVRFDTRIKLTNGEIIGDDDDTKDENSSEGKPAGDEGATTTNEGIDDEKFS